MWLHTEPGSRDSAAEREEHSSRGDIGVGEEGLKEVEDGLESAEEDRSVVSRCSMAGSNLLLLS